MRVAVSKKEFGKALSLLSKATEKKSRLSFDWAKLKAEFDKHLLLQGTNGEVYLTLSVPAEVEAEGEVCVEANALLKAVKSIKSSEWIKLYTEGDKLIINAQNITQKLSLKPVENFPEFPEAKFQASLPTFILLQGIEKTGFATSKEKDRIRYTLEHLYIDGRGDHIRIVGSDGHRLAVLKFDKYPLDLKAKLYFKSLKLLKELLKDAGQVQIGVGDRFTHLSDGLWAISIRDFSEYDYPDYDAVVPPIETYDAVVEVLSEDLDNVLTNFARYDKITFEFISKDGFRVKAYDSDNTEIEAWINADVYSDKQFSVDFVPKQLKEFTEAIEGQLYIEARFKDDNDFPALFRVNDNYFYLVMPLIRKKNY
jgi:DNA polymerase III sliding clamp (beta) subunit (PCNA family)